MSKKASELAREYFSDAKLFCAESVLLSLCEARGVSSPLIPAMATGFCSGVARTKGYCGAFTGAIMAVGALTGRSEPGGEYLRCYEYVQEFEALFLEKWSTNNCYEIIGVDFADAEDQKRFREQQLITKCFNVVEWTVDTVEELLG